MADLFLSYAREDRECAELLARAMTERGWSVWWDRQIHVGSSFSEVIERELGKAKCVLVLWSQHSLASDWVQNEAAEALHRKSLVPVRIEDVRPPLEFRRLQTADLLDWRQGFSSPDFQACITAIELLVGKTTPKPVPIPTPPRPQPQPRPQQPLQPPPRPNPVYQPAQTIPNYLVFAIVVTVLCCLPLGVVAIVYASQVNTKLASGDYAGAKRASDSAKLWSWISFGLGIVVIGFFFVIGVLGNLAQY
ncbi:MAG TPA: TIR domain-containing protein [Thermoanaerobaculia bacterium]